MKLQITITENSKQKVLNKARLMKEKDGWNICNACFECGGLWYIHLSKEMI